MGLLDSLSDIPRPEMTKRRGYNSANYSGMTDNGLYAALNAGNANQNQAMAQSAGKLGAQYGAAPQDYGAMQEMSMRGQLGDIQPMDEANKMRQFGQENQNAQQADDWARQAYQFQLANQAMDNSRLGDVLGGGVGYGMGALQNHMYKNKRGR